MEKNKIQESIEGQKLFSKVTKSSVDKARNVIQQYSNKRQEKEGEYK